MQVSKLSKFHFTADVKMPIESSHPIEAEPERQSRLDPRSSDINNVCGAASDDMSTLTISRKVFKRMPLDSYFLARILILALHESTTGVATFPRDTGAIYHFDALQNNPLLQTATSSDTKQQEQPHRPRIHGVGTRKAWETYRVSSRYAAA